VGFLVGRVLQGMGNGVVEVSGLSLLMRYSPDIRRDIGLLEGSSSLGFLLGPLLGGIIFKVWGFRTLFLLLTAPFLLFLAILLLVPRCILPALEHQTGQEQMDDPHSEDFGIEDGPPLPPPRLTPASFIAGAPHETASAKIYFKRLGAALFNTPGLPTYICIVLLVSAALGFFDTALSEHLGGWRLR
jgi:MFS family permease